MMTAQKKHTIAVVATVPFALRVYIALHIAALSKKYNIVLYSNFSEDDCRGLFPPEIEHAHIPFARKIRLWTDIKSLYLLYFAFRGRRFDAVHSIMPKSGLLAMAAAWAARVPIRIHSFTGQVWVNKSGLKRFILKSMDKVNVFFSTATLADSTSQRDFLIAENVAKDVTVLGSGSVCGVDINRFRREPDWRVGVRSDLGIPIDAFVFGFVGRLTRDKGIFDLAAAFDDLRSTQNAHLIIAGPDEEGIKNTVESLHPNHESNIHFIGHTDQPEVFMNAFDVFCLPSYREGFGSTVIEAAACGVPALTSRIYGLTDAVEENVTGVFHTAGDRAELNLRMTQFLQDREMSKTMSKAAYDRCIREFSSDRVVNEMLEFYEARLSALS